MRPPLYQTCDLAYRVPPAMPPHIFSDFFRGPLVMIAGFELNETHVIEEEIDHITPAVTARDVVDRETLKAFVTAAGEYCLELRKTGNFPGGIARIALAGSGRALETRFRVPPMSWILPAT